MAEITIKGLNELITKFEKITPNQQVIESAVRSASEVMLNGLKEDAPKDSGNSAQSLDTINIRNSDGYCYSDVGISKENWSKTRGLYFQNYVGERSAFKNVGWFNESTKKNKSAVESELKKGLKLNE